MVMKQNVETLVKLKFQLAVDDISAGTVVACLLIPQSMAYAAIAGVPFVLGLFAAIFPAIVYLFFGTSRYLSVGPVSIASILALSGISNLAAPGSTQYIKYIILLTMLIGVVQIIFGWIRLGSFFEYIPASVITGFIAASALIIALNQFPTMIGITLPSFRNTSDLLKVIFTSLSHFHLATTLIGLCSFFFLLSMKKNLHPAIGPLAVLIVSIVITDIFHLNQKGVNIIGKISQELPTFSLHLPSVHMLPELLPTAMMIGFISFAESYAVAKTLAIKEKEEINPNRELFSLGLANTISSIAGAIPVAGAISRSAVNHQSGARSKFSTVITIGIMILVLFYITPLFFYLPKATLAAIIIIAVLGLIDIKAFRYYISHEPKSACILLITFFTTFFIDIFIGLIAGLIFSILIETKITR